MSAGAETWTFALITPDAIVGGRLGFVLDRIAAHGLAVRAARIVQQDWARMARMYTHMDDPPADVGGGPEELPATVMRPLYGLAPGVVLSLHHGKGAACAQLLRCKGATRPERAADGTIRAAGEHLIFNFLHCPDDAASAAIELAYLLDPRDAAALRTLAAPAAALCGAGDLAALLPACAGPEAIAFPWVATRLRGRLVQALAPRASSEDLKSLADAHARLAALRTALAAAADGPAEARLALARAANGAIDAALGACALPDAWRAGLAALAALDDPDGTRAFAPLEALPAHGIYVSALELVTLDAHRHAWFRADRPPTRVPPRGDDRP